MDYLDSYATCYLALIFCVFYVLCLAAISWRNKVDHFLCAQQFARCMLVNVVADGHCPGYTPRWFVQEEDAETGNLIHRYTGEYWQCKERQDWSRCPDIYL